MDRSLSRRPRGGCEARVRRGTRQYGTGASKPRSRDNTTTAAGWPHDFSGASAARHALRMWLLAGADASLAVCPCGFVVCGRALAAPMGRLAYWRICGVAAAVVGRRRWCSGFGRCPAEGQSYGDLNGQDPPLLPRDLPLRCSGTFRPCVEPQKPPRQPKNMQVSPAPTLRPPRRETERARPS